MKHVTIHLLFAPMVLAFQQTHLIMIHRSQATTRNSYGWRCCSLRQFRWSLTMSADTERKTLAPGSHMAEMEVKKSRFLGYAKHVDWALRNRPTRLDRLAFRVSSSSDRRSPTIGFGTYLETAIESFKGKLHRHLNQ